MGDCVFDGSMILFSQTSINLLLLSSPYSQFRTFCGITMDNKDREIELSDKESEVKLQEVAMTEDDEEIKPDVCCSCLWKTCGICISMCCRCIKRS